MSRTKLKKFEKLKKMKHVIQPLRDELLNDSFIFKGAWSDRFGNNNPIVLELGCGKGEYTVALARQNPQFNYIGIDIKETEHVPESQQELRHTSLDCLLLVPDRCPGSLVGKKEPTQCISAVAVENLLGLPVVP